MSASTPPSPTAPTPPLPGDHVVEGRPLPTDPAFGELLVELAATAPEFLGITVPSPARAQLIGVGESYAAWRLDLPERPLVVRVPHRAEESLPRGMEAEFLALQHAPVGLGPEPVRLTSAAESPINRSMLVQTLVPGRVLPGSAWTPELLAQHAQNLASLHARRYPGHGPVGAAGDSGTEGTLLTAGFDPHAEWQAALDYWQGERPDLLEETAAGKLAAAAQPFLDAVAPAFDGIEFALIHGDAILANILVDNSANSAGGLVQSAIKYVDWEWSAIGDPARDLALIGAPFGASPWYLTLDDAAERALVEAYLAAGGGGGRDDLERLIARRRFHEVNEQLFTAVHFLSRLKPTASEIETGAPASDSRTPLTARQRPIYERAVRDMFRSVQKRILSPAAPTIAL